jgi:hypothetical protein
MARIPAVPAEDAGLIGALAYRFARRRFGAMPEPFARSFHALGITEQGFDAACKVRLNRPGAAPASRG